MRPETCYELNVRLQKTTCDQCGRVADAFHVPTRRIGHFCEQCCPVCSTSRGRTVVTKGALGRSGNGAPAAQPIAKKRHDRGSRAFAGNLSFQELPAPLSEPALGARPEPPPETAHEASSLLDRQFPWLAGAFTAHRGGQQVSLYFSSDAMAA